MGKHALITGSTGMIGNLILEQCLQSQEVAQVTSLVRRATNVKHDKLNEVVIDDFLNLNKEAVYFKSVDIVYYCLGVYTGAVNREKFRQITIDYPETLARILVEKNPDFTFCLLSGAGADRAEKSRMMFAMAKGIIENKLSKMGMKSFYAFRPGYIYPVKPRKEPNLGYKVWRILYPFVKLFGPNASIKSTELARAMFYAGMKGYGQEILENKDILTISRDDQNISVFKV